MADTRGVGWMTEGVTYGDSHGYPVVRVEESDRRYSVPVHRLVAVAEYGFAEVAGMDVHHKNNHPSDNSPGNLEVLSAVEHSRWHAEDRWGESPWRSEKTLREMYQEEKMSLTEIGEELGCTLVTVQEWMKRRGISRRTPREARNVYRSDENQRTLAEFGGE